MSTTTKPHPLQDPYKALASVRRELQLATVEHTAVDHELGDALARASVQVTTAIEMEQRIAAREEAAGINQGVGVRRVK